MGSLGAGGPQGHTPAPRPLAQQLAVLREEERYTLAAQAQNWCQSWSPHSTTKAILLDVAQPKEGKCTPPPPNQESCRVTFLRSKETARG